MKKSKGWVTVVAVLLFSLCYAEPRLPLVPGETQQSETAGATTQEQTAAPKATEKTTQQTNAPPKEKATPTDENSKLSDALSQYLQEHFAPKENGETQGYQPEAQEQLLAKIIYGAAADQPYAAKVAVGNVVINRMNNPAYPNTLTGVTYEADAPWPEIAEKADEASLRAARDALNGLELSGGATSFTRGDSEDGTVKLGSLTFTR